MEEATALLRPEPTRPRKPILTSISRATDALLDSLPCEVPERRREVRDWTDGLITAVRRFSSMRRTSGLFGAGTLKKSEADAALRAALKEGLGNDR